MICWKDTYNKYDVFWDKGKYSLFDASYRRFWICITIIHVDRIHKNTIMSDEYNVSSQSSVQCLPTRLPVIILHRVEEKLSVVREVMVCAVCRQKNYIIYSGDLYGPKNKMFSCDLMQPFIFCGFRFWGWFLISVVLNVLCNFSSISVITSSILVMIGYVREIRHYVPICCTYFRGFFESQYYILYIPWEMWTGFVWLLIGSCGKLLWTW